MGMIAHNHDLIRQYTRRILLDLLVIPLAFYMAWFIRFDCVLPVDEWQVLTRHIVLIIPVYILINLIFGIYRRLWAYAGFYDVVPLIESIGLSTLTVVVINIALTGYRDYRLSTGGLMIGGLLTLMLSTAVKYRRRLIDVLFASWTQAGESDLEHVLIVGLNETSRQLAAQMHLNHQEKQYELVGFVGDDHNNKGMNVNGAQILGTTDQIQTLVRDEDIDVIIITNRFSDREKMWQLISTCRETSAKIKVLPDAFEVIEGKNEDPLTLRDVSIDDILGRPPATISDELCQRTLRDKVILVTGGAGSIGSELCQQILRFQPRLLLAVDNNETGLYDLNLSLNQDRSAPLELVVADITDWHKMNRVFQKYKPQIVFHAAAYKHVPMVELHPDEAVRVNIMGLVIISEIAHNYDVDRFIFISTDKAVNPSSVMGASKRIGELWMKAMSKHSDTLFTSVRFGNVIGSRGSVLPTFTQQIESGGPVTVTHPRMHRFFISIPEAACLVLQAAAFSQDGGDVFMLEMGEEVSILDLAQRMIRLKGLRAYKDIDIEFIGVRPGEKLHEELAYSSECKKVTSHPRIYGLEDFDDIVDYDTLLGGILILSEGLCPHSAPQCLREEILQLAHCDIDDFLTQVTGVDLTRDWHQKSLPIPGEKQIPSIHASYILEGAFSSAGA
jgi:FlaA1/EpsC-like NDP-sugar epimerase